MAAEHQAAGGVAVEPVRERRRARQAEAQRVEIVLEGLDAFRPAMHGQARRLVHHQHQAVAVEQAGLHLFRSHHFSFVIPGRPEGPDPEIQNQVLCRWIPGSRAFARAPE